MFSTSVHRKEAPTPRPETGCGDARGCLRPWRKKMASRLKRPMAQFLWREKGTILQLPKGKAILLQPLLGQVICERGQGLACFRTQDNKSNISQGLTLS